MHTGTPRRIFQEVKMLATTDKHRTSHRILLFLEIRSTISHKTDRVSRGPAKHVVLFVCFSFSCPQNELAKHPQPSEDDESGLVWFGGDTTKTKHMLV